MLQLSLSELKMGENARIVGFTTNEIPMKLYDMGVIPDSEICVYKKAPLNGPICISVGKDETLIALRFNEAMVVLVEKIR